MTDYSAAVANTTFGDTLSSPEDEAILDAAEARFAEFGVRRTTVNDIADHAGVGRATVYRRIGGRDEIVQAVTARSAGRLISQISQIAAAAGGPEELIVEVFTETVLLMRDHPLWTRLVAVDPGAALTQLTTDGETVLATAVHTAAAILRQAADTALPGADDVDARAEVLVRLVHSLVLTPHAVTRLDTREELESFARTFLVPLMLTHR